MEEQPPITEDQVWGWKYFQKVLPVLNRLHEAGCERDKAHNRLLHFDQYIALILLYLFNPVVNSIRGMQQASELKKVQRLLGCPRASLGSLSEASRVFDAELLRGVIGELANELRPLGPTGRLDEQARQVLTLVDGTVLPALPRLTSVLAGGQPHNPFKRRSKLHVQFELLSGVAVEGEVTGATVDEKKVLAGKLVAGRLYVMDRGYGRYGLMHQIVTAGSSFVVRLPDNTAYRVLERRALTEADKAAGVVEDLVVELGCPQRRCKLKRVRLVRIAAKPHKQDAGQRGSRGGPKQGDTLLIATDRMDLDAQLVALIYKHRWAIETFFRFLKHVLGCRHLLSHHKNGITIQCYVAIIACLLMALWTGRKPTLRTYEMICFYFTGLADAEELEAHIARLPAQRALA